MRERNYVKRLRVITAPLLLSLLVAALYHSVLRDLIKDWWIDPNYSHGFLIPMVSGYLMWERRDLLSRLEIRPSGTGIFLLLFGIFVLCIGTVGAELFTQRSSLLIVTAGLILFNLGKDYLKILLFPLAFLIFMIPLPYLVYDSVAFPLRIFAAQVATSALQLIGVPILREGSIITLPSTVLEVADACSGLRSLMSLIALSVVFAYFSQRALWKRAVLAVCAIPIAISSNALRIIITGILAHYWTPALAQGFFHEFSGWLVFMASFLMLFVAGTIMNRISPE